jgi:toxin-antitoxin system PIN domain toxin
MKIIDANVLINAVNTTSKHHEPACAYLNDALSAAEPVVIPWLNLIAFARITTHIPFYNDPLTTEEALHHIDVWLAAPPVTTEAPNQNVAKRLRQLITDTHGTSRLFNDAYLAALAIENDAELVSFDTDFARFPGLRWTLPR